MHYLVTAILVALLAACGDNTRATVDAGPDAPVDPVDACPALELGTARLQFNFFNQLTGVRYPIEGGELDGALLVIELYDATTEGLPPLATGRFDLASAPDGNLATCQHCAYIARERADGSLELQYFQAQGSIELTTVTDPLEPVFAGVLAAQLRAATADDTGQSTFVPDGACRRVEALAFDTTPVTMACTTLTDCPNELLQVCDPRTQQCVAPQCSFETGGCTEDQACVPQWPTELHGACYDLCDPSRGADCGTGFTCAQTGPRPNLGLCQREGAGALGSACEVADASSACVDELVCSRDSETCTASCNLFDEVPGCSADTRCSLFGRCEPPDVADPAAFGEACASDAELAGPCGSDAAGFQGYCFAYLETDPLRCIEACLDDGDCRAEQYCAVRFTSGLGTCLPDPVCGDGLLGEIGEVCDDGNTTGSDTCSADCQTVNYAASCAAARPITATATLAGDTTGALDGFQASCQAGRARTELYRFTPSSPGRLTVTVDAATTSAVAVLASCGATPTEHACEVMSPAPAEPLVLQLTTADPLTISVAGFTVIDEGPHTVRVDFVPELCGDAIVAGREACDDGNATGNDGCSADCRTIEYDVVCATATPLSLTAANSGDTSTAPYLYENGCSAPTTGRDRVYTFTAPAAGTLSLSLDQGNADLGLAVFRGCGAPAVLTELACSSVSGPERASVPLAAGEQVTVVVDGFNVNDAGPYTLTATFQ